MRTIEIKGRRTASGVSIAAMRDLQGVGLSEDTWHTITQIVRIQNAQPKESNFFTSEGKYITTADEKVFNAATSE